MSTITQTKFSGEAARLAGHRIRSNVMWGGKDPETRGFSAPYESLVDLRDLAITINGCIEAVAGEAEAAWLAGNLYRPDPIAAQSLQEASAAFYKAAEETLKAFPSSGSHFQTAARIARAAGDEFLSVEVEFGSFQSETQALWDGRINQLEIMSDAIQHGENRPELGVSYQLEAKK